MEKRSKQTREGANGKSQKRGLFSFVKNKNKRNEGDISATQSTFVVNSKGLILVNTPKWLRRFVLFCDRHRMGTKIFSLLIVAVFIFIIFFQAFGDYFKQLQYRLSPKAEALLMESSINYGNSLKYDPQTKSYIYNEDYNPITEGVGGQVAGPKFTAKFNEDADEGVEITDPTYKVSFGYKPKFRLLDPIKQQNRVVYALPGNRGAKVVSLGVSGMKEDIIIESYYEDSLEFQYDLQLPDTLEARREKDGSIGIYGIGDSVLLGEVTAGTDEDAKLLETARKNAEKTKLLFKMPAPYIKEYGLKTPNYNAKFSLDGDVLTLSANNLSQLSYPISIDPTIYVETARKLMRGNNETNTDFDVDNELIQKSQTTGARIDSWTGNLDMSEGIWDHSTAVANGYVYRSGGRTGVTKPQIIDQQATAKATDSNATFVMDMPATRPAGDLYVALMCHDGTVTVTPPAGGDWIEYADTREHAAYYKIGEDEGGGNEAASYTWTASGNETFYGVIVRVIGFNSADPISGTAGTGSNASDDIPTFPATTPDDAASLVIRAVGADADTPSSGSWVPPGHTKIDAGNSGGTNSCGFVSASLDTPPLASVSSGTVDLVDQSINDTFGASSIAITPAIATERPEVVGQQATTQGSNSLTFTMDMPATRPAGDLYIALICKDGNNRVTPPGGGGWTEYADLQQHAAYWKIGTDAGGGDEAANYQWTVATTAEEWYGVILRVTGFDAGDPLAGTAGTRSSGSNTTPVYPTMTPDENKALIIRSTGVDDDVPTATGWLPSAHTKIASGTSGGGGDCGFTAASMDNSPASGVATGTATLGEMNDTYGASTIAIKPEALTAPDTVDATLNWAEFNSSTLEIESPNPGEGTCDGWCNDPTYNLPSARRGHSMVAYNGYLYVMGGVDSGGSRVSTIYIAKLGANGEPQLWHPTDPDKDNWDYWYTGASLSSSTARSYFSVAAYNNRLYLTGGQTNASTGGTTTSEYADILPNGTLGSWTSGTALPAARHSHMMHIYNDVLYLIGGNNSGTLQNSTHYLKLNSDGTMNSWVATTSFTTARSTLGGSYSTVWGAYIYLTGGCSTVNGSGYCTAFASDTQLGSINADGSISEWNDITSLSNGRAGYSITSWQGGLYRLGGCTNQDSSNGKCLSTLADVDYGVINPSGEVSTISISVASGVAPCSGGSPYDCNLPTVGDDAGEMGHMLNVSFILNGYLYVVGGCAEYDCNTGTNSPSTDNISSNTAYVTINSDGSLGKPSTCSGTSYGSWCVDSTNTINGADGVAAAGVTVFNNRVYVIGGIDSSGNQTGEIYYNSTNSNGSLAGAWTAQTLSSIGVSESVFYTYAFSRANPSQASTYPGNLYILGGCGNGGSGAGCGASDYETEVYKCWIETGGAVETTAGNATYDCTTTGQLQIDSTPPASYVGDVDEDGLGIHSGTVYANYIYLIGGYSQNENDKDDILYAKIDNSNNIVAVDGGSDWIESTNKLSNGRRRGWAFGYNGHIYSLGGYDQDTNSVIPFIEWSKIDVSDGSIDPFVTSTIQINQRWGLSVSVSNSYAYVVGGCDVGASPNDCSSFEDQIQTFQLYNNDSGSVNDFTAQGDDTFATNTDRIGASAAIHNGYIYVAGGCTNIGCTTLSDNTQYATISASDGTIGTWADTTDATLTGSANGRAFGQLEVAGSTTPTLYYMGGIDSTGDEKSDVYYGTLSSGNISSWTSTTALPADRAYHGGTVWDNRLYVVGGIDDSAAVSSVVYVSPKITGGAISGSWSTSTSFNVARSGAAVTAYANNLYLFGGYDGTNYLSDTQYASIGYKTGTISQSGTTVTGSGTTFTSAMVGSTLQYIDGSTSEVTAYSSATSITVDVNRTVTAGSVYTILDGSVGAWSYSSSLPGPIRDADAFAANGYLYLVGGRSAASTCAPNVLISPISANTTIATGNNPTGFGEWYETNINYTGDRYGSAVAYDEGKMYLMGGGCSSVLSSNRHYQSTLQSQPQVAIYSRMIDTDTDVFPNSWLMNGVDNSIGARWQVSYRSMNDTDGVATDCGSADMTTWGQVTNYGNAIMGDVAPYIPKDGGGTDTECARYFYFYVSIDASRTFGYPEDVNRGPTISDLSLFFTSDPNKRLRHGKTFTGGEQQPLDTPCRQSVDADCPLP